MKRLKHRFSGGADVEQAQGATVRIVFFIGIAASFVVSATMAVAQDRASTAVGQGEGEGQSQPAPVWSTTCSGASRGSAADCEIEQGAYIQQTGQQLGGIKIRVPAETRQPVIRIQLPLGLFLPAGVTINVDESELIKLPIQTCEPNGCYAGSPVSESLLSAMQKGDQLVISFQNLQKNSITIPFSLSGFTAAYSAIK